MSVIKTKKAPRQNTIEFRQFLRVLRVAAGMSQGEVAAKAGVSRTYLCYIENGQKAAPTIHVAQSLAKALGVPITYLFGEFSGDDLKRLMTR